MTHQDQHDRAIEDVLHALRTTESPQGYEARIYNVLTSPQSERSVAKSLLVSLLPRLSWAAACVVVLTIGIAVRSHLQSTSMQQSGPRKIAQSNELSPQPDTVTMAMTPMPSPMKQALPPRPKNAQNREEILQPQRVEVAIQTHEYIPEPPLPLTQQERLVIRMMRHNTAQQLSEYTPDARARQLHEDAQAYHDYFAATSLDGQPIYVQPMEHPQISGAN
ncbi:hypothetical protein [Terriglobus roseus]|uniref:Uncharacterized protein n=1 Tax=Terriglobus roseus TaxID=392734 RepID=A0A1G7N153_9BACT|nr:hypothetical protein [Terriglobus roseus]SDF67661.1 hypothetical protein SAMN05444167_2972 [Terriglobus roseus]